MNLQLLTVTIDNDERVISCQGLVSLAEVLHDDLHCTSVKIGCAEGYCGSCTVLVEDEPVLACLTPAVLCDGKSIRIVDVPDEVATIQSALRRALCDTDAVQCGMCTPGIVTLVSALIKEGELTKASEIAPALEGSICRCSGYARIVEAIESVLVARGGVE